MIKTFIKQLFTPKSRQAKSATADELSAAGSASGIAGTSREARKKLKALEKLQEQEELRARLREAKREQKQTDEFAARIFRESRTRS